MKEQRPRILVIDDEEPNREALSLLLKSANYQVAAAGTGEDALVLLRQAPFEVVVTDLFLPDLSGIDILKWVKSNAPQTSVIVITGQASAETAVQAMKEGALDYITKPFNFEELKIQIAKALEKSALVAENIYLRQQLRGKYKFDNIIGNSAAMQQIFARMERIVQTDSTILILGESGTGKELVAKAIHYNGPRKDKPFVAINCGAIPAELLESELFGHARGAFTGAVADKPGKFEQAHNGTLFLDEIGTMPPHLQMKLLRVLQDQVVERVGSDKRLKLNIRLISATNADLEEEVKNGQFREDLYYRLNVIPIHLPPMRERREDIPLLAHHFLRKYCREMNRTLMTIADIAMLRLQDYDWPGNVRELENIIERTVALTAGDHIEVRDLPANIARLDTPANPFDPGCPRIPAEGLDLGVTLESIERTLIRQALEMGKGVKARAAALLGLNRTTLVEKIKRLKLES
ncbi:sigma-54-dependent transcriptional regulator [Desulfuromonas acetexigens]|uniref:Sigma-54-dependent Fis family transcriptional regulator n=1 Tax=Trichloromonas acetexigens TaxID=38815 RepID=A0A550JD61_9BACT|nr:sigma-54 dependent transcriptional regulator [Desulfuromonas acetexigens]TRO81160.1 sigma-54-dependent Fis family transcriptional regulator [Desulfuromonas acetexigens]